MIKIIMLIIFFVYTFPVWKYRYQFRSIVYKRKDWKINVLPWFGYELHALFTNKYFTSEKDLKIARFYRWYLLGYLLLGIFVIVL